jgi:hypothetical protein
MVNAIRPTAPKVLHLSDGDRILMTGGRPMSLGWTGQNNMIYRVIAIIGSALALAACSSSPDWLNFDALKPAPLLDTVRFESVPPGAEARTSNGQTCRTPCALALPTNAPLTVTFTLNGYLPDTENLDPLLMTGSPPQMRPNPVQVELSPTPPPPKKKLTKKRHTAKKHTAKKPAAKKPATARAKPAAAPAPVTAAPAQQQAPSPWPAAPAPQR